MHAGLMVYVDKFKETVSLEKQEYGQSRSEPKTWQQIYSISPKTWAEKIRTKDFKCGLRIFSNLKFFLNRLEQFLTMGRI